MPVQRLTTCGDVFLVDFLLEEPRAPCLAARLVSSVCSCRSSCGQLAVLELGGPVQVVLRARPARSRRLRLLDLLAQAAQPLPTASFSACQRALQRIGLRRSGRPVPSRSCASRSREAASVSFLSASRSISSCMTRRVRSSSSAGIESISVRSLAAASSTRSMALSGRKRSEM